jgi:E3 ubiquitin-protein ligase MARCH6
MEIAPDGDSVKAVSSSSSASSSSYASSSPRGVKEREAAAKYEEEEEEEEDVCRICRNPGDRENPLRYPCACSGSIKFVHQDCLLQWLNHSNARQCEVSLSLSL